MNAMSRLPRAILCSGLLCVLSLSAAPTQITLTENPLDVVQDSERFTQFARQVADVADGLLVAQPPPDAATGKLLLALRVHVALHLREEKLALEVAEQIRASQTDEGEKAHSGLTTRALVASGRDPTRFEVEFTRLLMKLPRTPQVRAALVRSRQKIEDLSAAALLAEIKVHVAPPLARGEPCTLEIADQLIRAGHRLRTILPLQPAMLRAYDSAIAAKK